MPLGIPVIRFTRFHAFMFLGKTGGERHSISNIESWAGMARGPVIASIDNISPQPTFAVAPANTGPHSVSAGEHPMGLEACTLRTTGTYWPKSYTSTIVQRRFSVVHTAT